MIRTASLLVLTGAAAVVLPTVLLMSPVRAHGIQSTLERISSLDGGSRAEKLEVQSSFSSGLPASDAHVRLLPADGGSPIELGYTGADGRLTFRLPPTAGAGGEIQVDAGPGHRDYLELPDGDPTGSAGAATTHARSGGPDQPWPVQDSTALIVIGMVSGVGLLARGRRDP